MGAFFKKSTHLTEDELNKIADELKSWQGRRGGHL